jgi:hypothetical protein
MRKAHFRDIFYPMMDKDYQREISELAFSDTLFNRLLKEGGLYLVGGAVRDILINGMGSPMSLIFFSWMFRERLMDILRRSGSAVYVGASFGVIKFTYHAEHRTLPYLRCEKAVIILSKTFPTEILQSTQSPLI